MSMVVATGSRIATMVPGSYLQDLAPTVFCGPRPYPYQVGPRSLYSKT